MTTQKPTRNVLTITITFDDATDGVGGTCVATGALSTSAIVTVSAVAVADAVIGIGLSCGPRKIGAR